MLRSAAVIIGGGVMLPPVWYRLNEPLAQFPKAKNSIFGYVLDPHVARESQCCQVRFLLAPSLRHLRDEPYTMAMNR